MSGSMGRSSVTRGLALSWSSPKAVARRRRSSYALLRLGAVAAGSPVVLLPSDHYVSDDDAFMARVEGALEAAQARPEKVILLGIVPDRPETEYGWIEPSELLLGPPWPLYAVRHFWEKPP